MTPHAWEIENSTGCRWTVWSREDMHAEADEGHSVTPLYSRPPPLALSPAETELLRVIRVEFQQPEMLRVFPDKVPMAKLLFRLCGANDSTS